MLRIRQLILPNNKVNEVEVKMLSSYNYPASSLFFFYWKKLFFFLITMYYTVFILQSAPDNLTENNNNVRTLLFVHIINYQI